MTAGAFPAIPFVARRRESATLRDALARAGTGHAGTIFLTGESGIGKTRLAGHLAEVARREGVSVAEGRAFAVESGLPFAIFADALLPLLRALDPAALTVLTRGAGSDLAAILPGLFPPSAAAESAADGRARLFWSFSELLARLAARAPLLLILDNLQWSDASSLELLHFVARRAAAERTRLLIVATDASPESERLAPVRVMEQSLVALGAARVLPVEPLSADEAVELVSRSFDVAEPVVRLFAETLHRWTRGNPFFMEETLKSLVESGRLAQRDGRWIGWDSESFAAPRSVRDVVLARLARLTAPARTLLDLAAVLGTRLSPDTLRATSDLAAPLLADALDELLRAGFLVADDAAASYDFTHPLVRDALYTELGAVRTAVMHDRVAASLEAHYGPEADLHASELAHHLSHGTTSGRSVRAIRYLREAGRQALERHADRAAITYLERALAHATAMPHLHHDAADGRELGALTELLARARQRIGDVDGAAALWREVRERAASATDAAGVAAAERRLGLIAASAGRSAAALEHFDAGLRAIDEHAGADDLAVRLLLSRATTLHAVGRRDEALDDATRALDAATAGGERGLLTRAHRAMLLLHAWTGPAERAREHGRKAVALAAESGEQSLEWSVHWAMAVHGGLTGDVASIAHHLAEARRLAEAVRSPVLRLWTADVAIEYLAGIGEWTEALALAHEAIPSARALGQRTLLPRLLVWTGLVHRGLGDLEQSRIYIDEAWTLTEGARDGVSDDASAVDVHAVVPAHMGRCGYLMTTGDNAGALAVGEAGLAIADRTGYVAWAIYRLLPFVIESALYLEDYERAARHNARLRRDSAALGHALGLAWADTTDALLAYLTGDASRAVPMLRSAMLGLERVPFVFDAARLRRLIARALTDAGDVSAATAELRRAHAIFERLGAERELQATREQLRALGARAPVTRRRAAGEGVLSAREVEIARLVAARRSNKEIASALHISARTVSTHLSNIFAKLEVGSRGELTDRVRGGDLGDEDR